MTWIVARGRWTQEWMDEVVKWLHRKECGSHDGRRSRPPGPLGARDRIAHEATVVAVIEALEATGFTVL